MRPDRETIALFERWLVAAHADQLQRFRSCRCAATLKAPAETCSGHIVIPGDKGFWPDTDLRTPETAM